MKKVYTVYLATRRRENFRRFTLSSTEGGFAPILIVIAIILLIPLAYFLNKQYIGLRLPWQEPFIGDGVSLTSDESTGSQAKYTSPTPSTTDEGSANWKTYTNSKYKYTLKYPPELNFSGENPTDTNTAAFTNGPNDHISNSEFPEEKFVGIYVSTFETKNQTLDVYLDEKYPANKYGKPSFEKGLGDKTITRIFIGKEQGYLAVNGMLFESKVKTAWIKKGGTIFEFVATHNGETGSSYTPEAGKTFDQILTTFRFE